MSAALEANKALVRRFFEAISYGGDLAALDDICIPEYAHHADGEPQTLTWLKDIVLYWRTSFPDTRYAVEDLIAEGDKVWARWTLHGTHLGEFRGNPPTGKVIRVENCFNIFLVGDGRLVEDTPCWLGLMGQIFEQIGGVPPE